MKKLMTMLAAVATAFGLYATDTNYGTSFEDQTAGTSIFDAETEGAKWSQGTVPADKALVTTYASAGIAPIEGNQRPDQFKSAGLANFLDVKTTLGNPIARNLDTAWDLANGNFYSDTLVRFTYFDSDPENIGADAKIAVWAKEIEEDNVIVGTNLMVTALGAGGNAANFCVYQNWKPTLGDDWARVTIKAIPSVLKTGTDKPGFVVWIDGNPVGCTEAKAVTAGLTLSDIAAEYNKEGQLFLSMVQNGGAKTTINAVAFDGQGQIDDVSLTSVAPAFAADPQFFYLDGDANVVSLQVNSTLNFTKAQLPVALPWADEDTAYDVVATYANGYVDGTWTITAGTVANGCFTPGVGGAMGTVVSKAAFVKIGGKFYATLAEALADTPALQGAGGLVQITDALTIAAGDEVTTTYGDMITIDLNGQTISYAGTGTAITAAKLTVKDTSTTGTTVASGAIVAATAENAIRATELVIENGKFNGIVTGSAGAIGGWYAIDPTDMGIVADGYKANAIEQDPYAYEIVAANYVAQINDGKKYESFAEAVAALEDNDTLNLLTDCALVYTSDVLTEADNVTFDLGEHTLSVTGMAKTVRFGVGENKTLTVTNGTIALEANGYGFSVCKGATLNVYATFTKAAQDTAGAYVVGPIFDIFGARVNVYAGAVLDSAWDVFRGKTDVDTTDIYVYGGTITSRTELSTTDPAKGTVNHPECLFYHYKAGVMNVTVTGGTFESVARGYFGSNTSTHGNWGTVSISDVALFKKGAPVEYVDAVGKIKFPNRLATADAATDGYFKFVAGAGVTKITADNATVTGVAMSNDTFAAGQTLALTVTPAESYTIESVKVNGADATAGEAGAYTYVVTTADVTSGDLEIVATAKSAGPEPVEPGKDKELEAKTKEAAEAEIAKLVPAPTAEQEADGIKASDLKLVAVKKGDVWYAVAEPDPEQYTPEVNAAADKPIEVTDTEFKATIATKAGFYYGFVECETVGGTYAPAASFVKATGTSLTLEAPKKVGATAEFFKLSVSAIPVTVKQGE